MDITLAYFDTLRKFQKKEDTDIYKNPMATFKYRTFRVFFRSGKLESLALASGSLKLRHITTIEQFEELHFLITNERVLFK